MTPQQLVALIQLSEMLTTATDAGLFDELCAYTHPDTINQFCDAVESAMKENEG